MKVRQKLEVTSNGTGIAMGRHSEKVGEVASMVTGTVKEEGITMALKKLGLI